MRTLLLCVALIPSLFAGAQKMEERLDERFKPATLNARYYVETEKADSLWHRKGWYLPELGMAWEGWYTDREGKKPEGVVTWFHPNRTLKSTGKYVNGKKEGTWLSYHDNGMISDSSTYVDGKLRGIRYKWHNDGSLADSTQFNADGNGVQVSWYKDGGVSAAGYWTQDTLKRGRWQYYHPDGTIMATEDYTGGQRTAVHCYDAAGKELASCEEKEATFPGNEESWRRYLERNLNASIPVTKGAPPGYYTVRVQFIVNKDGSIEDVKAQTNLGYGTEEEVVRLIKKGPKWVPAQRFGQPVKAYRIQPVTFVVSQR